jgi:hypothetical protein
MMALRHRLTLLAAATVGVTVVLVSVVAYYVLRNELRTQVDDGLAAQYVQVQRIAREFGPGPALGLRVPAPSAREGGLNGPVPQDRSPSATTTATSSCRSTRAIAPSRAARGARSCATSRVPTACTCGC